LFSSRRRHTRFTCDWSSDVCSSDLQTSEATINITTGEPDDFTSEILVLYIIEEISAPVLTFPENAAINQPISLIFDWADVVNATEYEYEISTDQTFSIVDFSGTIAETEQEITGLDYGTEYFWKVQATNTNQTSEWSEIWSFTTLEAVGVKEVEYQKLLLYPNPAKDKIFFDFEDVILKIKLYNSLGYEINQYTVNDDFLNCSELPAGIYFIEIYTENGKYMEKIIIIE